MPATIAAPSSAPEAAAPAPRPDEPEVRAADSTPPGVEAVSKGDQAFASKSCKPLTDAIAAAAKKKKLGTAAERTAFTEEMLQHPPQVGKLDVARCADIMLRDLRGYLARTAESEAEMNIGRIVVGLAAASEHEPPSLCASAGPVPADRGALGEGAWTSKAEDWSAPGWKCARFDLAGQPQRFQYRLVTDAKAGSWEVVAVGTPVKGAGATELYARGKLESGRVQPTREVFRRAPR